MTAGPLTRNININNYFHREWLAMARLPLKTVSGFAQLPLYSVYSLVNNNNKIISSHALHCNNNRAWLIMRLVTMVPEKQNGCFSRNLEEKKCHASSRL